jgi:competence protein ComEC
MEIKRRFLLFINFVFLFSVFLNFFVWLAVFELSDFNLKVVFFDVGQGDSIFIKTPNGNHIIIDGGPDNKVIEKLGREMPFWKRTIDVMVLTHPHADHIMGLIEVLKRYKVKNVLWNGMDYDSSIFLEWKKLVKKEGAKIYVVQDGSKVKEGSALYLNIINPYFSESSYLNNIDNNSVVSHLIYKEYSFLFTGDIFSEKEKELVKRKGESIKSNVLKVSHHGSKTSSDEEFIKYVSPEIAVISVGKNNRYGHPNKEVLERLIMNGAYILRTDEVGDIKIFSDGKNLFFKI